MTSRVKIQSAAAQVILRLLASIGWTLTDLGQRLGAPSSFAVYQRLHSSQGLGEPVEAWLVEVARMMQGLPPAPLWTARRRGRPPSQPGGLSPASRTSEMLGHIASGLTVTGAAQAMGISRSYAYALRRKAKESERVEVTAAASSAPCSPDSDGARL